MRQYLSFFKLRFITNLQYRSAAIAGIFTQFFFGLLFIMVYLKFYETGSKDVAMTLEQTITYLWLQQALFSLIYFYHREKEIINMRFYKGKTQMEIAQEIGISQAQVSRLEKGALERIKKNM